MNNEQKQAERQAIIEAAIVADKEFGDSLSPIGIDEMSASDNFKEGFKQGAEFALSELRKSETPSEDLVNKIASMIEADLIQSYAPNFYDEDDGVLSLLDLFSHTDTIDSGRGNIKALVDGLDCIEEIAKLIAPDNSELIKKDEMFDFIRWMREDDRFNGGQSLKMFYEQFQNAQSK